MAAPPDEALERLEARLAVQFAERTATLGVEGPRNTGHARLATPVEVATHRELLDTGVCPINLTNPAPEDRILIFVNTRFRVYSARALVAWIQHQRTPAREDKMEYDAFGRPRYDAGDYVFARETPTEPLSNAPLDSSVLHELTRRGLFHRSLRLRKNPHRVMLMEARREKQGRQVPQFDEDDAEAVVQLVQARKPLPGPVDLTAVRTLYSARHGERAYAKVALAMLEANKEAEKRALKGFDIESLSQGLEPATLPTEEEVRAYYADKGDGRMADVVLELLREHQERRKARRTD